MKTLSRPLGYNRIILLILAGESVFMLPFLLARIFRPTFLSAFQINNFELGTCFTVYGIVALLSYLYGGAITDHYPPRKLLAAALLATALGGVYMGTFPELLGLQILFGYWGFTTIFLFWGAMIKATRSWGGNSRQGQAFGFLEGGRGLLAAFLGMFGVMIFARLLPAELDQFPVEDRQTAFRVVIWSTSAWVAGVGLLIQFLLKDQEAYFARESSWVNILQVLQLRSLWLVMWIVLAAYVGYKITDVLSLYSAEVMQFNEVDAARVGSYQLYLRPLVCVLVGFLADRSRSSFWILWSFIILGIGAAMFAMGWLTAPHIGWFVLGIVLLGVGVYSLRTLYFAVLEEAQIPLSLTGTAVGLVSVVGYTPDIFIGPLMGYLLDNSPGIQGHQQVFGLLLGFVISGLIAAFLLYKRIRKASGS